MATLTILWHVPMETYFPLKLKLILANVNSCQARWSESFIGRTTCCCLVLRGSLKPTGDDGGWYTTQTIRLLTEQGSCWGRAQIHKTSSSSGTGISTKVSWILSLTYRAARPPRLLVRGLLTRANLWDWKTWAGNHVSVTAAMWMLFVSSITSSSSIRNGLMIIAFTRKKTLWTF